MVTLEQAKQALGETAKKMTDEEIQTLLSLMDHLADQFLEKIEKTIYGGKTINQLLYG